MMNTSTNKFPSKYWEEVTCIFCDADFGKKLIWADEEMGYIVQCQKCDLVFRSPRRTESYLDQHFTEEWTQARPAFFLEDYREKNLGRVARWIQARFPNPGAILDIGSSYGSFLGKFPNSWRRVGVEPSGIACQVSRNRLPKAEILNSTFNDAPLQERSFDVITMVDTLYYLPNPLRDFSRIRELLKPGGIALIECQNFTNRGRFYRWIGHKFDETWMYFYTPNTLAKLFSKAGMEVIARFDLPGHQVGARSKGRQAMSWLEFFLSRALVRISRGKLDLVPHFVMVARRC